MAINKDEIKTVKDILRTYLRSNHTKLGLSDFIAIPPRNGGLGGFEITKQKIANVTLDEKLSRINGELCTVDMKFYIHYDIEIVLKNDGKLYIGGALTDNGDYVTSFETLVDIFCKKADNGEIVKNVEGYTKEAFTRIINQILEEKMHEHYNTSGELEGSFSLVAYKDDVVEFFPRNIATVEAFLNTHFERITKELQRKWNIINNIDWNVVFED